MVQSYLSDILHVVAQWLLVPDIILLLLFIGYALFCIGGVVAEYFTERRHFSVAMPKFLKGLMDADEKDIPSAIEGSGLLKRQKDALLTVYEYRTLPGDALLALVKRQVSEEETHYDRVVGRNNVAARVAPMLGLMGTLIPLGPGIEALGRADTAALSSSLLVAFDTTVAGLVVAAVCLVVGKVRSAWYENYLSAIDAAMATMLEKLQGSDEKRLEGKQAAPRASRFETELEFEPMPEFTPKTKPVLVDEPKAKPLRSESSQAADRVDRRQKAPASETGRVFKSKAESQPRRERGAQEALSKSGAREEGPALQDEKKQAARTERSVAHETAAEEQLAVRKRSAAKQAAAAQPAAGKQAAAAQPAATGSQTQRKSEAASSIRPAQEQKRPAEAQQPKKKTLNLILEPQKNPLNDEADGGR